MQDIISRGSHILTVISPEDCSFVCWQYAFQLISPVHLQLAITGDVFRFHEILDSWSLVPAS